MMSYRWNMQALILSRLNEMDSDKKAKIGLLASDGMVTTNRRTLRLVSSPVHTKLMENPDLTILDMKHHKKANIESLLLLIDGGKISFDEDINNLAEELEIHLTKSGISTKMIPSTSKTKLTKKGPTKNTIEKETQKMESGKVDVKEEPFEFEDSEKIDVKEEALEFTD